MALADKLADKEYDIGKMMYSFAVLYIQDSSNFSNETAPTGPPAQINDIVEIDPAQGDYGEAQTANGWRYAGDTDGGLNLNISRETTLIDTDQHAQALEIHQNWTVTIEGGLLQFETADATLDNILQAYGGGSLADVAGTTPAQKKVTLPLSSTIAYQRAALIYPHYDTVDGEERTLCFILRKASVRATGAISFVGRDKATLPVALNALPDDRASVDTDEQIVYGFYAPGT